MSLLVVRADTFVLDVASQFAWYATEADEATAWRFVAAVDATIKRLADYPEHGRPRHFAHPSLQGIRSIRVETPFDSLLIFYKPAGHALQVWRLLHGARDLPRQLTK